MNKLYEINDYFYSELNNHDKEYLKNYTNNFVCLNYHIEDLNDIL